MTTTDAVQRDVSAATPWPIIDSDVHEMFRSPRDLLPYLDQPWAHYVDTGWAPYFFSYAYPTDAGFARVDAIPDEGPAGSDYELMRRQLLDAFEVSVAVLTGLFFPSDNNVQFELATSLATAYNRWLVDNWLSKDDRFRGSICVNVNDPAAAAAEIHRLADNPQFIQVMLPPRSDNGGYGHQRYQPILEAAAHCDLPIALHPSAACRTAVGMPPYLIEWRTTSVVQHAMSQVVSMICGGVFDRWPNLRVTMVEGGWTWVPHLMWRLDQNYRQLRQEVPWLQEMPSDYMRRHFRFTTQPVETLKTKHMLQVIEQMESDELLLFSSDYPHFDFDSPHRALKQLPSSLLRKIQHENPATWYRIDGLLPSEGPV